jgi:hypothetical protein
MPYDKSLEERHIGDLVEPHVLINKHKGGENEQERAVRDKLARFSRVPASTVFKFVLPHIYSNLELNIK